jgi:CspA family cold shock protein
MSNNTVETSRTLGRVKWFNNKAGFGFITVSEGSTAGSDLFVHHSAIRVKSEQYKYLVQGEYVEFSIEKTKEGDHDFQAGDVTGVREGILMCETRREQKQGRKIGETDGEDEDEDDDIELTQPVARAKKQQSVVPTPKPRSRGAGPRDGSEWTLVKPQETPVVEKKPRAPRAAAAGGKKKVVPAN